MYMYMCSVIFSVCVKMGPLSSHGTEDLSTVPAVVLRLRE